MPSFFKRKYLILLMAIMVLSGCSTKQEFTDDNTDQNTMSNETIQESKIKDAITLIEDKKYPQAIGVLSDISDNEKADDLLEQLRYIINGKYIANIVDGIAAINNNREVEIIVDDSIKKYYQYDKVSNWSNIKSLSFALGQIDALDEEGLIHSSPSTDKNYNYMAEQLSSYKDIIAMDTEYDNYTLLSKTGSIIAYSAKYNEELEKYKDYISTWSGIVDVVTAQSKIAALKKDGTVYVANFNKYAREKSAAASLYDDVADWTDIVAISVGSVGPIVGLKSDGTVVVSKNSLYYKTYYDVSDWKDIIAISNGNSCLLGLKRDGTVVATGDNENKQLDVSGWTDIVAIATGDWISIGLKSDGSLVVAGTTENDVDMPDVSGANDLYVPTVKY
ncbi:hypothetical protein [Anaerosporobacter sp.]